MPPKRTVGEPNVFRDAPSPSEMQANRRPRSDSAPSQLGSGDQHSITPPARMGLLVPPQQEEVDNTIHNTNTNTLLSHAAQPLTTPLPVQAHQTEDYRLALAAARDREEALATQMRALQAQLENMERERAAPMQPPLRDTYSTRDYSNAQLRSEGT